MYTVEELDEIIRKEWYDWNNFEVTWTGELYAKNIRFSLRVGLYMLQPMQAIIAEGQFVRMKTFSGSKTDFDFMKLDPKRPDLGLYTPTFNHRPLWMPPSSRDPDENQHKYLSGLLVKAEREMEFSHQRHLMMMLREIEEKVKIKHSKPPEAQWAVPWAKR